MGHKDESIKDVYAYFVSLTQYKAADSLKKKKNEDESLLPTLL
jgi:hypothetical protein